MRYSSVNDEGLCLRVMASWQFNCGLSCRRAPFRTCWTAETIEAAGA